MVLYIIDHPYHYEAENLCRVFYPFDKVTVQHEFMPSDENRTANISCALKTQTAKRSAKQK